MSPEKQPPSKYGNKIATVKQSTIQHLLELIQASLPNIK